MGLNSLHIKSCAKWTIGDGILADLYEEEG